MLFSKETAFMSGIPEITGSTLKTGPLIFEKLSILGLHVVVELLWICDVWSKKINRERRIVDSTQVL